VNEAMKSTQPRRATGTGFDRYSTATVEKVRGHPL
jgi:hypothetical protein